MKANLQEHTIIAFLKDLFEFLYISLLLFFPPSPRSVSLSAVGYLSKHSHTALPHTQRRSAAVLLYFTQPKLEEQEYVGV